MNFWPILRSSKKREWWKKDGRIFFVCFYNIFAFKTSAFPNTVFARQIFAFFSRNSLNLIEKPVFLKKLCSLAKLVLLNYFFFFWETFSGKTFMFFLRNFAFSHKTFAFFQNISYQLQILHSSKTLRSLAKFLHFLEKLCRFFWEALHSLAKPSHFLKKHFICVVMEII